MMTRRGEAYDMSWIAHYYDPKLNANALTRPCTTKKVHCV
jgi:hypothetical protein